MRWESADQGGKPDEPLLDFSTSRPNIARAYDYLLGGKNNFASDRILAEQILDIYPRTQQLMRENRAFLARAISYTAARGINQFIDLGCGLPTSPATHEVARQHSATAAVAYVDNDPVVITHARALLAGDDDHIAAVPGDLADPAAVLTAPDLARTIDLDKPACVILAMVLHFQDADTARKITAAYTTALAPRSYVIISAGHGDGQIGEQITHTYDAAPLYNHTPGQVTSFFTGLHLVNPGIVDAREWPRGPLPAPAPGSRAAQILAGVGQKSRDTYSQM